MKRKYARVNGLRNNETFIYPIKMEEIWAVCSGGIAFGVRNKAASVLDAPVEVGEPNRRGSGWPIRGQTFYGPNKEEGSSSAV